jgi:hypothetical protein
VLAPVTHVTGLGIAALVQGLAGAASPERDTKVEMEGEIPLTGKGERQGWETGRQRNASRHNCILKSTASK